jgi:hypothetical protein
VAFFTDNGVVALLIVKSVTQSHKQAMLPRCAQARLALTKKSSTGGLIYG